MSKTDYGLTPNEQREYQASRRRQRREYMDKLKSRPCEDCGKSYPPYVVDFDHVSGQKVAKISEMTLWGWKKLQAEVSKCQVVCANCHRIRTHERLTIVVNRGTIDIEAPNSLQLGDAQGRRGGKRPGHQGS